MRSLVLLLFLTATRSKSEELEDNDYGPLEDHEEVIEDAGKIPEFTATDITIDAFTGDRIHLPCEVDKLGKYDIMFKKDPESNSIISVGGTLINNDWSGRVLFKKLEDDKGMTLTILNATVKDSGDYACFINVPEADKRVLFHVSVGDKASDGSRPRGIHCLIALPLLSFLSVWLN